MDDAPRLAQLLHERHGCAVIVTGGHGATADDVLCDGDGRDAPARACGCPPDDRTARAARTPPRWPRCWPAALPLREAAAGAKEAATEAVRHGLPYGAGAGPVDVFGGV